MSQVIVISQDETNDSYEARLDSTHGEGTTLGAALDQLLNQLGDTTMPLLLVRQDHPDHFFTRKNFERLQELQLKAKSPLEPLSRADPAKRCAGFSSGMNALYPLVAARAEHRCEFCRAPEIIFNFRFEVEHIVPQASSGTGRATVERLQFNADYQCHARSRWVLLGIFP
jgi:hypothetical protein